MITTSRQQLSCNCIALVAIAMSALLAACAAQQQLLNSERIEARYGSYAVRVLQQDERIRVSSLESFSRGHAVTRTLAITQFAEPAPALADIAARIRAGASIGSTFRKAGFQIEKPPVYIGTIEIPADASVVAQLMGIELPASLAMHAYQFDVSRHGERYRFATITELHHPDYLQEEQLRENYGVPETSNAAEAARIKTYVQRLLSELPASVTP
ncbi:MAG: hypothetical protein WBM54_11840 [Woeseia sp.]